MSPSCWSASHAVWMAPGAGGAGSSSYSGGSRDDGLQNLPWLQRVAVQVSQSELLRRCLATVVLVLVLRLMCFIPLPGVDMSRVSLTPSGEVLRRADSLGRNSLKAGEPSAHSRARAGFGFATKPAAAMFRLLRGI